MDTNKVELYIYDLSKGMAAAFSPMLIGKRIQGIWHTSIVVYNREYFFGSKGVESCNPGTTALERPLRVEVIGETQVPYSVFIDYLNGLSETTYAYNSLLLEERRKTLKEKLIRKEKKREKKRKKILESGGELPPELKEDFAMADTDTVNGQSQLPSDEAFALEEEEERREEEAKKKAREPPIVYKDIIDVKVEFDALVALIDGKLNPEEQRATEELQQYMIGDEGSWALSDGFLDFVGRLLNDTQLSVDVRVKTLNVLAMAALKDDVILVLHQDRKDHILMNYAFEIDRLSIQEQEAIALFMANMFENLSSSEWLLYISEWTYNNQQTSNIRVTTKVAVHSLLSDSPILQDRGAAIIHNLACKEVKTVVFDDVAVELTMALLQYFNSKPPEEQLYRCMKALAKFVQVSTQEVPQLIQMIGPDPRSFKGVSDRVDSLVDQIALKLR
ncbi:uncharacterized protein LOC130894568 isoform X6 [Diorhabda carinulata]|uniref:uncharacterized protein LOC130894568 isoform X6 n=1 Tax=Diorhabda carinulata TaxID=1163345 RepID=UPI00259FE9CC|nr:uncharacterized protein LOC130894568 isoform X6 [Diorhabda carinulata]